MAAGSIERPLDLQAGTLFSSCHRISRLIPAGVLPLSEVGTCCFMMRSKGKVSQSLFVNCGNDHVQAPLGIACPPVSAGYIYPRDGTDSLCLIRTSVSASNIRCYRPTFDAGSQPDAGLQQQLPLLVLCVWREPYPRPSTENSWCGDAGTCPHDRGLPAAPSGAVPNHPIFL